MALFCNNRSNCVCTCQPACDVVCGPTLTVTSNVNVARVCGQVQYTVTINNTTNTPINCSRLFMRLPKTFCFEPGTLALNGVVVPNGNPENVELGTIGAGTTNVLTYTVTVMECNRYNKTVAALVGYACCCFENKKVTIPAKHCLQVCCCCNN